MAHKIYKIKVVGKFRGVTCNPETTTVTVPEGLSDVELEKAFEEAAKKNLSLDTVVSIEIVS